MFNPVEIVGIVASVFIVFSLAFKTTTFKGTLLLRILNNLGCIFFVVYGALVGARSTLIANAACLVINLIYTVVEINNHKKQEKRR